MSRSRTRGGRWVVVLAALMLASAIGTPIASAQQDEFPAVDQPGVSDDEIRVGGVVTEEGSPTGAKLTTAFDGVKAYFDYINETEDGVYGRKLVLSSERDDRLANNRSEVQGLLSQDDIFAVLPVAVQLFDGADLLADAGVPTFGWNINGEWGSEDNTSPENFFGQTGSFICFTCGQPRVELWLAQQLKAKKVGVLAFAVPQSSGCAEGIEASFKKFPKQGEVVFSDKAIQFGNPDYSAQVAQMKEEGVNLVLGCIDGNGAVNLAREMKKQQLDGTIVMPNAYNHDLVSENADVLDGNYLFTTFAPFETRPKPEGLKLYDKWIKETDGRKDENSMVGWLNADLFVEGLKAAGPDFTREKLIDAINAMTSYNGKGLLPPIDWTTAHEDDPDCYAGLQIEDGKFVPAFGDKSKPFLCFPEDLKKIPAEPQTA